MTNLTKKVKKAMEYISNSYYVSRPNLTIDGEEFNDVVLFTFLTYLNGGKQIMIGNYGDGKTTVCEAVNSIFHSLPLELMSHALLRSHPERTKEEIIGRPHLGKLNLGDEEVIWTLFVLVPAAKLIDEFNRLPGGKQVILQDAIERGNFDYLNGLIRQKDVPFLCTNNYPDSANTELAKLIQDRFETEVEVTTPSGLRSLIRKCKPNKEKIKNEELYYDLLEILLDKEFEGMTTKDYEVLCERVSKKQKEFYNYTNGLSFLEEERKQIKREIEEIVFSEDASLFIDFLHAELTYDPYNGQVRASEERKFDEDHWMDFLIGKITKPASNRLFDHAEKYAKALAWLKGKNVVDVDELMTVFPYAMSHRLKWRAEVVSKYADQRSEDCYKPNINLYIAKGEIFDFRKRFKEDKDDLNNMMKLFENGKFDEALKKLDGMDHPFYKCNFDNLTLMKHGSALKNEKKNKKKKEEEKEKDQN